MDEFPDPEDEFEMLHAEEMEVMREMDDFDVEEASREAASIPASFKRSLDFRSPQQPSITTAPINKTTQLLLPVTQTQQGLTSDTLGLTQLEGDSTNSNSNSRKRPPDDGFADSFDVSNFDIESNKRKRARPLVPMVGLECAREKKLLEEEEADLKLIEKITQMRESMNKDIAHQALISESNTGINRQTYPNRIYTHLPISGGFQAITTESGGRFYLGMLEEDEWDAQVDSVAAVKGTAIQLTAAASYNQLKVQAQREQIRRDAQLAKQMQDGDDSGLESGIDDEQDGSLWVEKFKPRQYLDLLSDELTNRTVLHWIKLWDKLVFGIMKKPKKNEDNKKKETQNNFNKFQQKKIGPEVNEELDEHNRPMQKVLLLAGPPGLGKTTLAHVLGGHAGYNTLEINASNDRSPEAFRFALETAATMKSVIGRSPKPNCLVMDEIDGAPAPSINLLVNMLTGKDTGRKNKKGRKEITLLQRPVICICNDLYTPALRPLRQIALVVQFPPTNSARLAQRLLEVSRLRELKADLSVLMALCDKTENDIRSCLSILQFVRSSKRVVTLDDIVSSAIGQKDHQRSLFSIWTDIFSIPRQKRLRRNPLENSEDLPPMPDLNGDLSKVGDEGGVRMRIQRVLRSASHAPYDMLTQGFFHNYLMVKTASLDNITAALDWALFTDTQLAEIQHHQSWILMGYLPYACVSYHLLFATHQYHKIQFPSQMNEANQKLSKMRNLISAMVNEMTPSTRASNPPSSSTLVCDILPYLIHIIQPNLRPVNTQLYSKQEKCELLSLIDTMLAYNITYTQERDQNGQYSFNLDPNIEEIVQFANMKPSKQLSYPMRQLVSREVELEKVRRSEAYFVSRENEANKTTKTNQNIGKPENKKEVQADKQINNEKGTTEKGTTEKGTTSSNVPSYLRKLKAKPVSEPVHIQGDREIVKGDIIKAPRDFFGRVILQPSNVQVKSTTNEIVKSDIWFRFKEGYSNAVRRTIKMTDLG